MSVQVSFQGSVASTPATGSSTFPTETRTLLLNATRNYTRHFGGIISVTGTDGAPQDLDFGGMATIKFLAIKVQGDKIKLRITTADGAAQIVPVSGGGQLIIDNPSSADITAITLATVGSGVESEYLVAGP